jgi:excisionase family DNA binding protein
MIKELPVTDSSERWLSVDEIATHLGVSTVTIYRWLEKGGIPAHRVGKLWKFKRDEVDHWVRRGSAKAQ